MFFTISEFGKRSTTTVRTLRYYEELGLLVPTNRNAAGHKLYGFDDLTKLQQIQSLKFLGYSLQDIKSLVKEEADVSVQLEESLHWQHQLLTEKRKELNQRIDAIEHVQYLLEKGKIVTWKVLSSLLFRMENEQEQIEWVKEVYSEDMARRLSEIPKKQQRQIDVEMLDWLAVLKELMNDGAPPESPEALQMVITLTEIAMKQADSKEELLQQMEQAKDSMDADVADFMFPTFLTPEEEAYLEEVGKSIKAAYGHIGQ